MTYGRKMWYKYGRTERISIPLGCVRGVEVVKAGFLPLLAPPVSVLAQALPSSGHPVGQPTALDLD